MQNLTFTDGNATGSDIRRGSGGAIYAEGGQLKVVNSRFINNRCYPAGPDLGGAAIRALSSTAAGRSTSCTARSPAASAPTAAR